MPKRGKKKILGEPITRRDALAKATGVTLYADDFPVDNCAYIKVVRSPHHHAKIVNINIFDIKLVLEERKGCLKSI